MWREGRAQKVIKAQKGENVQHKKYEVKRSTETEE